MPCCYSVRTDFTFHTSRGVLKAPVRPAANAGMGNEMVQREGLCGKGLRVHFRKGGVRQVASNVAGVDLLPSARSRFDGTAQHSCRGRFRVCSAWRVADGVGCGGRRLLGSFPLAAQLHEHRSLTIDAVLLHVRKQPL